MKKIILAVSLLSLSVLASGPKYKVGDCITPVDPSYSWYGHYSMVTDVEEGYDFLVGKSYMYLLNFRTYNTRANRFVASIIDSETKKVNSRLCLED